MKKVRTKKRSIKRSKPRCPKGSGSRPPTQKVGASGKKVAKKKPASKKPTKKRKVVRPSKKSVKKRAIKKKPLKKTRKPRKRKIVKKRKTVKKVARKKTKRPIKKKVIRKRVIKAKKPKKRVIKRTKKKPVKKAKKRVVKKRRIAKKPVKKRIKKRVTKRKPRRRKKIKVVRRVYSGGGPLEQLFESPTKVQVMKLFFRNPEDGFLLKEAAKLMRQNLARVKQEIKRLEKIGFLRAKQISPRKQLFSINPNFDFFNELRELILRSSPVSKDKMLKAIRGLGKIKIVLLSGLFVGDDTARADLLIVGDNINQRKLAGFIKNLEAEAGTEINCVVMNTEEFNYRYDMYDRFVRDLLSEKCEFLVNRLGI